MAQLFSLGAMARTITYSIRLLAFLLLCASAFAAPFTKADLVGIYRLDTTTLYNQTVPTNFYAFSLTLNTNGSFVATNVPADFFFSYPPTPAAAEARGTWKVRHESEGRSLFYTGENDYLDLDFTTPSPGSHGTPLQSYWGTPRIYMAYHTGKDDAAVFYLIKQK